MSTKRNAISINKEKLAEIHYQAAPLRQILSLNLSSEEKIYLLNFFSHSEKWELSINSIAKNSFGVEKSRNRSKKILLVLCEKGYLTNQNDTYTVQLDNIQNDYMSFIAGKKNNNKTINTGTTSTNGIDSTNGTTSTSGGGTTSTSGGGTTSTSGVVLSVPVGVVLSVPPINIKQLKEEKLKEEKLNEIVIKENFSSFEVLPLVEVIEEVLPTVEVIEEVIPTVEVYQYPQKNANGKYDENDLETMNFNSEVTSKEVTHNDNLTKVTHMNNSQKNYLTKSFFSNYFYNETSDLISSSYNNFINDNPTSEVSIENYEIVQIYWILKKDHTIIDNLRLNDYLNFNNFVKLNQTTVETFVESSTFNNIKETIKSKLKKS